jgi:hypothetical protein
MEVAKWLVTLVAIWNFGGYVADAVIPVTANQHLHNPHWPPHAKFHNCQTMVMGIMLGLISLCVLFASGPLSFAKLLLAAVISGTYFVAMLFAPVFPGTEWHDPEFARLDPMVLGLPAQKLVAFIICALLFTACILAYTVK